GGTLSNFSGSGTSYSATVTPTTEGAVTVDVVAGVFSDAAGNTNTAATQLSRNYDVTQPTVAIASTSAADVNGAFAVSFTLSESSSDFASTDVTVSGGTLS
ncbi:Ig-like domain-containing protein, partial [Photobacterium alginatilyticum]|uniref:Ig-like domain-containing protein n=1 Tax=Photobacterium alginatilyticum TaxID=1775171 RepID=UPI004067E63F